MTRVIPVQSKMDMKNKCLNNTEPEKEKFNIHDDNHNHDNNFKIPSLFFENNLFPKNNQVSCKFFNSGFCFNGKNCKFLHDKEGKLSNDKDEKLSNNKKNSFYEKPLNTSLSPFLQPRTEIFCQTATLNNIFSGKEQEQEDDQNQYQKSKSKEIENPFLKSSFSKVLSNSQSNAMEATCPSSSPIVILVNGNDKTHNKNMKSMNAALSRSGELCVFATVGKCRYGASFCRNVHGLQCPRCLQYCLYPNNIDKNEEHINECLQRPEAILSHNGNELECGICLEQVSRKPDPRFGLQSCNHAFCLDCIRTWRSRNTNTDTNGNDNRINDSNSSSNASSMSRSCPLCRMITYYIIPSSIWITDPLEKIRISDLYKKNLQNIPCKYYIKGTLCPFGTSCFYLHQSDNLMENENLIIKPRSYIDQNEKVRIIKDAKFSDFIEFNRQANNFITSNKNKNI